MKFQKGFLTIAAAFAAYRYGLWAGYTFWSAHDPYTAALYGGPSIFVAVWLAGWAALDKWSGEGVVTYLFAGCVTYWYAVPVGFRYFGMTDRGGAALYGSLVILPAALVGKFAVWPLVEMAGSALHDLFDHGHARLTWATITRKGLAPKQRTLEEWEAAIEAGMPIMYAGKIDRKFRYIDGGFTRSRRIFVHYQLSRHSMAMPPREREGLLIFKVLSDHKLLDRDASDRILHGLTWGDGQCKVYGGKFTIPVLLAQQNGIKGFRDIATFEANERNASTGGALSELFVLLAKAASDPDAPKDVIKLHQRHAPPPKNGSAGGGEDWD